MHLTVFIIASGFADWSPAEWIFTVGGCFGAILGAWAKYESAKNKQKLQSFGQQVESVGKQVDRNTDDVRDVRNQVTDAASNSIPAEMAKALLYAKPPGKEPWYDAPPDEPSPPPKNLQL